MKIWKFWAASPRPKDIKRISKKTEIRVDFGSLVVVRVDRNLVVSPTSLFWKSWCSQKCGGSKLVKVELCTCLECSERWVLGIRNRVSNRYPSWDRDGWRTTTVLRLVGLYRPAAWRRNRPLLRPSVSGNAAGGTGVVRMWCVLSHPAMASSWSGQPLKFLQEAV